MSDELKGVGSIIKLLSIMDCFSFEEAELGVMELSKTLKMPKATVSRMVNALERKGYLEQNSVTKKYRLGLKLFYLGSMVLKHMEIRDKALPIMEGIMGKTGESMYLNIIKDDERMCLLYVSGKHDLQAMVYVGQRSPLYAGASAKVLLAFLDDAEIDRMITKKGLAKITPATISDPEQLKKELVKIREQGYSYSAGERVQGVISVSAPVRNHTEKVICSLSMSIPEVRADWEKINHSIELVLEGAKKLSFELGWDSRLWSSQ